MEGITIALLMQEPLSQIRANSPASQRERAALELRRIEKEVRTDSPTWLRQAWTSASKPFLGHLPRLAGSTSNR